MKYTRSIITWMYFVVLLKRYSRAAGYRRWACGMHWYSPALSYGYRIRRIIKSNKTAEIQKYMFRTYHTRISAFPVSARHASLHLA